MSFQEALTTELDKRGWSQRDLANHLDIDERLVSMWKKGDRLPSKTQRANVAKFLRVNLSDLGRMIDTDSHLSRRVDELEQKVDLLLETLKKIQRAQRSR